MGSDMSHKITMTYTATNSHTGKTESTVTVERDGELSHFIDTFEAFLVASGFTQETAEAVADSLITERLQ